MSSAAYSMSQIEQKGWGHLNEGVELSPSALPPAFILKISGKLCSSSLAICIGHLLHPGLLVTFPEEAGRRKRGVRWQSVSERCAVAKQIMCCNLGALNCVWMTRSLSLAVVWAPWERRYFRAANGTAWPVRNLPEPSPLPLSLSCPPMDPVPAFRGFIEKNASMWPEVPLMAGWGWWFLPSALAARGCRKHRGGCCFWPSVAFLTKPQLLPNWLRISDGFEFSSAERGGRSTLFNSLIWTTRRHMHNHRVQSRWILSICITVAAGAFARVLALYDSRCPGCLFPG